MNTKNVLIICGGGASSGFLAQKIKKAAKEKGILLNVKARSEAEVGDYIDNIDVLLFGPHLKYMEEDLTKIGKEYGVPVAMIDQTTYGSLDGDKALEMILSLLKN
ncbi:MAG: PTS sugar transporter subunit IIB [Tepidanaerobacter acetatoxydans]|uniref:PTS sugar transporter subunit IIB n=1 Tax=Tepidanaerobacter acetatoxydans TaxID=499229 RepID=UPI0026EB1BFF|nr:PTS sugar transporter subunit IIB [Tepidanaerobacter acetatoxydans]NLU11118.1 PTS sugar transporter subunit IIB [Tepidanaerobacter acetatoxydans]